jgi:hypothetical protein
VCFVVRLRVVGGGSAHASAVHPPEVEAHSMKKEGCSLHVALRYCSSADNIRKPAGTPPPHDTVARQLRGGIQAAA